MKVEIDFLVDIWIRKEKRYELHVIWKVRRWGVTRWSVTHILCGWWSQVGRRRPLQGATGPRRVLAGLRGAGPGVLGTPGTCHRMGPLLGPSHHPSPLNPTPRSPTPTRTPLARRVSLQAQSNKLSSFHPWNQMVPFFPNWILLKLCKP